MEPVKTVAGDVSVLDRDDVDTDQIIPKQFLKRVERTGFGQFLFYDWAKEDGWDLPANPILAAGRNFGSGSSREHAPWALVDYGFRAVVSTSIADIFRNNSLKNGLIPVVVDAGLHAKLLANPGAEVTVSIEDRTITLADGSSATFAIEPFARYCLLNGVDELAFLLSQEDAIAAFEARRS
jgi:3-isopropylmalate/(R)-2-methylmalate dehydratase small subunit